ncbi:MAG: IS5 family transposase [Xenococcaceae cyanobacterium]
MSRRDLTTFEWEQLKPLLPPLKPRTGRPYHDHRQVINGVLWILRTGAPWRDLPERYGSWQSVATRFYRWQKAGVWQQILANLQTMADKGKRLDWEVHYVDGSVIRAHQHAAGGKKRGEEEEQLGRCRGGFSTKIHLRCEGSGKPMTFVLTPGQRNESIVLEQLMSQGSVKRISRGRPRLRPQRIVGDKGYTGRRIRNFLRRRGICLTIPRLSNEKRRGPFSREIYRQRNVVERTFNRLKQFRRIATRYEKLAVNYTAMRFDRVNFIMVIV